MACPTLLSLMSTPYIQTKGLPPRRIQKKPRVLSYNKCQFCRDPKVKTKCVWNRGSWPNKCQRCSDKGLPCSEPRHKAEERAATPRKLPELSPTTIHSVYSAAISVRAIPPVLPKLPGLNPLRFRAGPKSNAQPVHKELKRPVLGLSGVRCLHDDPGSSYQAVTAYHQFNILNKEFLVLQLLPLHGMMLMVLEEMDHLSRDFLAGLDSEKKRIWCGTHEKAVNLLREEFQQSADHVRQALHRLAPHSKLAMEAALDLTRFSFLPQLPRAAMAPERLQNIQKVEEMKERYSKQGHFGMVILLTIYQSTVEDPFQGEKSSLKDMNFPDVGSFLDGCIVNSKELRYCIPTLRRLDWFTPIRSIANLSSARSRIRKAGFKDYLGRSVPLIELDADCSEFGAGYSAFNADWLNDPWLNDRPDHLGRTLRSVDDMKSRTKRFMWH